MLSKGSAKQNFGAVCWLCWRAGKLNSCPSFRKFLGQAQPLGDAYTPRPRIQSWRSHSVCHLGPPRLPNDQGWVLQGWAQKAAGRLCSWLALWSCQVLKPGSNSLDGSGSASTMMWLQRCQLKLIKIHVVLYDVVIKRAQFPNGVRVFAGFKVEFFPGLNLCAYSCMIGNLCCELSLPRSSHTALIRPLPSTQNCWKNSHRGQPHRDHTAVREGRQAVWQVSEQEKSSEQWHPPYVCIYRCTYVFVFIYQYSSCFKTKHLS